MRDPAKYRRARLLGASFFVTALLAAAPFAFKAGSQFLGRDVSSLAVGIMGFYPWIAVSEAAKLLGCAWLLVFLIMSFSDAAGRKVAEDHLAARLFFAIAPVFAYVSWLVACAIHYPALFDDVLPETLKKMVFRAAFRVSPQALYRVAAFLFAAAPVALLMRRLLPHRGACAVIPRNRRLFTSIAIVSICGTLVAVTWKKLPRNQSSAASTAKPHVLVIGVDSLRYDRLGIPSITPHLTALRDDPKTVSFEDHFVGVPRTFPSWIEMIQGKYAAKTGIRHMFPGFGERSDTKFGLVTAFRDAGYRTVAVSDFAGDIFPRFEGGFQVIDAPKLTLRTMIKMTIDRAFPLLMPLVASELGQSLFPALRESPAYADPGWLARRALEELGSGDTPTFLTLFFSTAHFPYAAPFPHYKSFAASDYSGAFRFEKNPEAGLRPDAERAADVVQVRALYDGAVQAVDAEVGRIMRVLKARGQWDNTIVIVTADHGEDLYEEGVGQGHGEHLRGRNVLQVPLLIKMPATASVALNKIKFISRSIDIAATIAGVAGLASTSLGDGTNLTPWMRGEKTEDPALLAYSETELWFERNGEAWFQKKRLDYPGISGLLDFDQGYSGEIVLNPLYEDIVVTAKHRMIADARYKLIYMPTPNGIEYELYDRQNDPADLHDIATADPLTLSAMKERLVGWIAAHEGQRKMTSGYVVPR